MTLRALLKDGGRKYAVGVTALRQGFVLCAIGLLVAVLAPAIAAHIANILGTYALMVGTVVGTYQVANALGDKWNPTQGVPIDAPGAAAAGAPGAPAPRQSGRIPEPTPAEEYHGR